MGSLLGAGHCTSHYVYIYFNSHLNSWEERVLLRLIIPIKEMELKRVNESSRAILYSELRLAGSHRHAPSFLPLTKQHS